MTACNQFAWLQCIWKGRTRPGCTWAGWKSVGPESTFKADERNTRQKLKSSPKLPKSKYIGKQKKTIKGKRNYVLKEQLWEKHLLKHHISVYIMYKISSIFFKLKLVIEKHTKTELSYLNLKAKFWLQTHRSIVKSGHGFQLI